MKFSVIIPGMKEKQVDRNRPDARHGGDLCGKTVIWTIWLIWE